jgi:CBS domain-containing protein
MEVPLRISEVMSTEVKIASPKQSIQDAALMMVEIDAGVIPVAEGDRLVGMITDRDIAVRAVAAGKPPQTPIADVMSPRSSIASTATVPTQSLKTWLTLNFAGCRS